MNENKLKMMLTKIKANVDIATDPEAQKLIESALDAVDRKIDLQKVMHDLKQDINMYSVAHGFKLPETLTKLQLLLDKNPDKWVGRVAELSAMEIQDVENCGHYTLRHGRIERFRDDKRPEDCLFSQIL